MVLGLREFRRLLSRSTYNSERAAPLFFRRSLCTAAKEEEAYNEDGVLSKRALMQGEGFTEPQIEAVLAAQPRSDRLCLLLTILKDRGIDGPTAGAFVSSQNRLLHGNLNTFHSRLQALEDAGISAALLKKAILQRGDSLSTFAAPGVLQEHLPFFKDMGLSLHDGFNVILRCPSFVRLSVEKRLKPLCEFLCRKGVSKGAIKKIIIYHPYLFTACEAKFFQKVQIIEEFGLDLKNASGVRALGLWSRFSAEKLYEKFDFLKSMGLSHEEVTLMVCRVPCVLSLHEESLRKRIQFYRYTLKFSLARMISSSALFTCSFEKRVIPRWSILQDLREKGLLKKPVSFAAALALPDKEFNKRYKIDPGQLL
ncbi:hypothetical protein L7F22_040411 [Adiantum nelumboides]|nr:hypothetical protein [Adiantum nelumboides]